MKKGADDYLLKITLRPKELEDIIDKFRESLEERKEEEEKEAQFKNEFDKTKKISRDFFIKGILKG